MNVNAKIMLGIRNFFKKYKRIIIIVAVIWIAIIIINQVLKNRPVEKQLKSTYNPNNPVMDEGETVPNKYIQPVNETIDKFFNYCNKKDYENAYGMISTGCKEYLFENDINNFKDYVNLVFDEFKIYNYQNFSNVNDQYIYNVNILNDIESTGTTDKYDVHTEKWTIAKEGDEFKIGVQGFIETIKYSNVYQEDNYIKVKLNKKNSGYSMEEYEITITNKTDKYIVLSDESVMNEVMLNLGDEKRNALNLSNNDIYLLPQSSDQFSLIFKKYYDDGNVPSEINFNSVRVFDNINDTEAEKNYSFNFNISK